MECVTHGGLRIFIKQGKIQKSLMGFGCGLQIFQADFKNSSKVFKWVWGADASPMGQPSPRPCMSVCLVCNIFSVALFGIRKGGTDYRARVCNSESADKKQIKGVCAELWKRKYEFPLLRLPYLTWEGGNSGSVAVRKNSTKLQVLSCFCCCTEWHGEDVGFPAPCLPLDRFCWKSPNTNTPQGYFIFCAFFAHRLLQ